MKPLPPLKDFLSWIGKLLDSIYLLLVSSFVAFGIFYFNSIWLIVLSQNQIPADKIYFIGGTALSGILWGWQTSNKQLAFILLPFISLLPLIQIDFFLYSTIFCATIFIARTYISKIKKLNASQYRGPLSRCALIIFAFGVVFGVLNAFLIPKTLPQPSFSQNIAIAREAADMIASAFGQYTLEHKLTSNTTAHVFIEYLNYVSVDTQTRYKANIQKDNALQPCSEQLPCLKLHSGAIVQYDKIQKFGTNKPNGTIFLNLDPDGNGPEGRSSIVLFYDGRLVFGEYAELKAPIKTLLEFQKSNPDYADKVY